jgi:hypothetical protein
MNLKTTQQKNLFALFNERNSVTNPSFSKDNAMLANSRVAVLAHAKKAAANECLSSYNFLANANLLCLAKGKCSTSQRQGAATEGKSATQEKKNFINTHHVRELHSEDIIKLISAFFKTIYCLISRPKFINTPDKIIIEILYYITIPDHNIFKWYNFIYPNIASGYSGACGAVPQAQRAHNAAYAKNAAASHTQNNIIKKNKKKPTIKTILYKNFLVKKTLFKLNNTNIVNLYFNKFAILFKLLQSQKRAYAEQVINKPIEFNLIRLHKSDYDSNILAQLFILILKKKNIRIAINKLFTKNNIASAIASNCYAAKAASEKNYSNASCAVPQAPLAYISGLYIKIGGRLMREPIIPRITTKNFEIGAIATGKVNFVDSARITKKNKKGAFTIKITYAQNFVF